MNTNEIWKHTPALWAKKQDKGVWFPLFWDESTL